MGKCSCNILVVVRAALAAQAGREVHRAIVESEEEEGLRVAERVGVAEVASEALGAEGAGQLAVL